MTRRTTRKASGGRFARLPLIVLGTPAVTTLGHAPFRVLVLLAAQYNGYNNGSLGVTRSQGATNGIASNNTLYRALRDLESRGLIDRTYPASRIPPRPAMYAITWVAVDDTEWSCSTRLASHDYREWKAVTKQRKKTRLRVVQGGK